MTRYAVTVEDIGKEYVLGLREQANRTFREAMTDLVRTPWRRIRHLSGQGESNTFWALRNVSFDVQEGEVLGIIGHNGAGKSTLLKILSQITEPTEGRALVHGRVASLLEVGTGFHPELSGRENVFLNGAILGMSREEIRGKFDEVVSFAGVERFLDTPIKRYSSGMKVRLAFAVAAHLEPEILVIDEVLAVGDAEFQSKCLGKMDDVARSGRTVLFVSHNMAAVRRLCHSALFLKSGRVIDRGHVDDIVDRYMQSAYASSGSTPLAERQDRGGTGTARLLTLEFFDRNGASVSSIEVGDQLIVRLAYEGIEALHNPVVHVAFYGPNGDPVTYLSSGLTGDLPQRIQRTGTLECRIPSLAIAVGRYAVNLCLQADGVDVDHITAAGELTVTPGGFFPTGRIPPRSYGSYVCRHTWAVS